VGGAEDDGLDDHHQGHEQALLLEAAAGQSRQGERYGPEAALFPRARLSTDPKRA
jgi:hypothetical protein